MIYKRRDIPSKGRCVREDLHHTLRRATSPLTIILQRSIDSSPNLIAQKNYFSIYSRRTQCFKPIRCPKKE